MNFMTGWFGTSRLVPSLFWLLAVWLGGVVLLAQGQSNPPPRLGLAVNSNGAGPFSLTLTGAPGATYLIQHAPSLPMPSAQLAEAWALLPPEMRESLTPLNHWVPHHVRSIGPSNETASIDLQSLGQARYYRAMECTGAVERLMFPRKKLPNATSDRFELSWVFANDLPGVDQVVRLRSPGPGLLTLSNMPGSRPATGPAYYLSTNGLWGTNPVPLIGFGGLLTNALPVPEAGNWQLEMLLLNRQTGDSVELAVVPFLVGDAPAIRLGLSRPIATPDEPVSAKVVMTAGSGGGTVQLLTWLVNPDGSESALPPFEPGAATAYAGPATNREVSLFHRTFATEGTYRVEARLVDGTGSLLGLARREFEVCASSNIAVTGTVYMTNGSPWNTTGAAYARVRVMNLGNGRITVTNIAPDGTFSLTLAAGQYLLTAVIHDTEGVHQTAESLALTLTCSSFNEPLSLTTAPPEGRPASPPSASANLTDSKPTIPPSLTTPDLLPAPTLLISFFNQNAGQIPRVQWPAASYFRDELERMMPGVSILSEIDVASELRRLLFHPDSLTRLAQQEAIESNLDDYRRLGDFILFVTWNDEWIDGGEFIRARLYSNCQRQFVSAFSPSLSTASPNSFQDSGAMTAFAGLCRDGLGGFAGLRAKQCRPIQPHLQIGLNPHVVAPNGLLTATATLREGSPSGALQTNWPVQFFIQRPDGSSQIDYATTDINGRAIVQLNAGLFSTFVSLGFVEARFLRYGQVISRSDNPDFRIQPTDASALTLTSPDVQLPVNGQATITLTLNHPAGSPPGANTVVQLTAQNGALPGPPGPFAPLGPKFLTAASSTQEFASITLTNGSGTQEVASITLTAGALAGLARVNATCTVTNNGVPQTLTASITFSVETGVQTVMFANPPRTFGGLFSRAILDSSVHGARLNGAPVLFTLDGFGTLANASTATDASGRAEVQFLAPTAPPSGTSIISGILTFDGRRYTNTTSFAWEPFPECLGYSNSTYCIQMVATNAELIAINDLGQMLYKQGNSRYLWKQGVVTPVHAGASFLNNRGDLAGLDAQGNWVIRGGLTNRIVAFDYFHPNSGFYSPIRHLDDEGWAYAVVNTNLTSPDFRPHLLAVRDAVVTVVDVGATAYTFIGRTGTVLRKGQGNWVHLGTTYGVDCGELTPPYIVIPDGCPLEGPLWEGADLRIGTIPYPVGAYEEVYSLISRTGSRRHLFTAPVDVEQYPSIFGPPSYGVPYVTYSYGFMYFNQIVMNSQEEMICLHEDRIMGTTRWAIGRHGNLQTVPPTSLSPTDGFLQGNTFNLNSQGDAAYLSRNQQSAHYWQRKSGVFQQIPIPEVPGWTPMTPTYRIEGYQLSLNDNGQIALKTEREVAPGQFETALWLLTPLAP